MTSPAELAIVNDVELPLSTITIANGFDYDLNVAAGFLVHYIRDFSASGNNLVLPMVAVQPLGDDPVSSRTERLISDLTLNLVGAVTVSDSSLVRSKLLQLQHDVRKVLLVDADGSPKKSIKVTLGSSSFDLPEGKGEYAFFEMKIVINYMEAL